MSRDPLFVFDSFFGFLVILAYSMWLVHIGFPIWEAIVIFAASVVIASGATFVRWMRTEASNPACLSERFSKRNLIKNLAVGLGFLGLTVVEGGSSQTIFFETALIFGLGSLAFLVEWLLWRRHLRRTERVTKEDVKYSQSS